MATNKRKIQAASDHLSRIVGTNPIAGVEELIWNALDAVAMHVDVRVKETASNAVDSVIVADDGHGFSASEIDETFNEVGGSWKHQRANRKTRDGARDLHGDKGEGRWKAFSIGVRATWESVTAPEDGGTHQRVRLQMDSAALDEYEWSGPIETVDPTGTTVTVVAGMTEPNRLLTETAASQLTATFALYLLAYPAVTITYRGKSLDPDDLIVETHQIELTSGSEHGPAALTIVHWDDEMNRGIYLCDENQAALHRLDAGVQAPGYHFTAYIAWRGFRIHESVLPLAHLDNDQVAPVLVEARQAIRDHFKKRRDSDRRTVVEEWQAEDVYPYKTDPTDPAGEAGQALFNYVAVAASAAVNTIEDKRAKALSLRTIRLVMEQDPTSLEVVLREVLALPEEQLEEFRTLLERTPLTAMLGVVRTITGRLEFLAALEHLLFDPDTAPKVLERAHLHKILENEPWIFGEEYALHVSDRSLTAVLNAHLKALGRTELAGPTGPVTDADGNHRRVDFMFGRALEHTRNRREHLVVEIKRPTIEIGRTEIAQIEDYAMAVAADSRFDSASTEWDFLLVGVNLDKHATDRANTDGSPRGLILSPKDSNVRVWLQPWKEITAECKHRLKFVRSQLEYDPSTDQAVAFLRDRYPEYLPAHLRGGGAVPN
ncbi:MAG: ATP-binding protein [Acidimicrobiales bacterium]